MNSFNISVFAKDANFKLTADTMTDHFATYEPRYEDATIPAEADLVVRTVANDELVMWMYEVNGKAFVTTGIEDESFLVNYPFQRDFIKTCIYSGDESSLIEGTPDILTVVYGNQEIMANMGYREQHQIHLLTEAVEFNPEEDVLVDETAKGEHYFLLYRNGEMLLDKTRELIRWGYQKPALISTINFVHPEDNQFARNMAVHF